MFAKFKFKNVINMRYISKQVNHYSKMSKYKNISKISYVISKKKCKNYVNHNHSTQALVVVQ